MLKILNKWLKLAILSLIWLYRRTLSPDEGWFSGLYPNGFCPYEPHCSVYCYQAIEKYGIVRGAYKGLARILRCHPWTAGGHDPV
ncbi:MAG: membrane protein insertion efficiency factor YidD [Candidatus Komeilibacteria bacterium]